MDDFIIYYGLTFLALIITVGAQIFVETSYSKYKKVKNERGLSGAEAARYLLNKKGLQNVKVLEVRGHLSDHYDPRSKVVRLSSDNFHGTSIAAVSVACHECGHAIQDSEGYAFMRIRAALVPVVNFSSYAGYFAIVFGCLFGAFDLIWFGILLEAVILLFQLITLPVEINASSRALKEMDYCHFFNSNELKQGKVVLGAAAMTYVASVASTVIELLRLILLFGRRDD